MQIDYTPEQKRFRDELREYFAALMTDALTAELAGAWEGGGPEFRKAMKQMGRDGLLGVSWPKEYGGQERSPVEQFIFADEVQAAGFPFPFLTLSTVGPMLQAHGTEEQRREYLPEDPRRRALLRNRVLRALGRDRPRFAEDERRARRRRLGDQRAEDVDEPGGVRRLRLARGANRPRCGEAPGALDLSRPDQRRGFLAPAHSHRRWRHDERDVLRRRSGSSREPDRRREQRLEVDHRTAQSRAHLADDGGADCAATSRRSPHGRRRPPATGSA